MVLAIGSNNTDVTVDPASLTFTASNWASAQDVRISAKEDEDPANANADVEVTINVTSSADTNYLELVGGTPEQTVTVTVNDDDAAALVVLPLTLTVVEDNGDDIDDAGETQTYTVNVWRRCRQAAFT